MALLKLTDLHLPKATQAILPGPPKERPLWRKPQPKQRQRLQQQSPSRHARQRQRQRRRSRMPILRVAVDVDVDVGEGEENVLEVGEVAGEKERRVILCTDALDEKEAEETEENENASRFVAAYI